MKRPIPSSLFGEERDATEREFEQAYHRMIDEAQWTGSGFPLEPTSVRVTPMNRETGTHHMVVPVNQPEGKK